MGIIIDLTGQRFGRLVVLSQAGRNKQNRITWLCQCNCGNQKIISGSNLSRGNTKTCGCAVGGLSIEYHGLRNTIVYNIWKHMLQRCYNKNNLKYKYYGERGIRVCLQWHRFTNFYKDMGDPPKGYSIDRINNDSDYTPENCRWADNVTQANNKGVYGRFSSAKA